MKFEYRCTNKACEYEFEAVVSIREENKIIPCPRCGQDSEKQFRATSNFYIPPYFQTMKSDIFDYDDWKKLKSNPNIERAS